MTSQGDHTNLSRISSLLEALPQPAIELSSKNLDDPTPEQIAWAILVYCYAILHHARTLLRAIITHVADANTPAALILTRALFEVAASVHYIQVHALEALQRGDRLATWHLLTRALTGNSLRHRLGKDDDSSNAPKPLAVGKLVQALNEMLHPDEAQQIYDDLSEHSHPNMGALVQYYDLALLDGKQIAKFHEPLPPPNPPVAETELAMVVVIAMTAQLARWCDSTEASQLREILDGIMQS